MSDSGKLSEASQKIIKHVIESIGAGAAIYVVLKAVQFFVNDKTALIMQSISNNFADHHKDFPVGLGLVGLLAVGAALVMYGNAWWSKNLARWGVYPVFDFVSHVSSISAGFVAVVLLTNGQIVESALTFLIFASIALISAFTAYGFRYGFDSLRIAKPVLVNVAGTNVEEVDTPADVEKVDSWKVKILPVIGLLLFPLVVSLLNYFGKTAH